MKFPHVAWAASQRNLAHYRVAESANMSESRFSRCLSGRADFSTEERRKISVCLGFPISWLFEEVSPPGTGPRIQSVLVGPAVRA
jgi:hypothetical protein